MMLAFSGLCREASLESYSGAKLNLMVSVCLWRGFSRTSATIRHAPHRVCLSNLTELGPGRLGFGRT